MKILFLGDSITEAGRDFMNERDLGAGYVKIFALKMGYLYPDKQLEFVNRGVSGYGVADVLRHVDQDLAETAPDLVVLLIGVNDVACRFTKGIEVTAEKFRESYQGIVDKVLASGAKLICLQPFVIKMPDKARYRRFFDPFLAAIDEIVEEKGVERIPLDGYFNGLINTNPATAYTADGIHPTHRASRLIADSLVKASKKYIEA